MGLHTSSSSPGFNVAPMALLPVDLDSTPDDLVALLAVDAAVRASVGLAHQRPGATGLHWAGDDDMWMALIRPGEGRALLAGWHPEFSLTGGGGSVRSIGTGGTDAGAGTGDAGSDLVGDAPGWWRRGVEYASSKDLPLGFLYGWDGTRWWRSDQPVDDGFDPELFPVTRHALREIIDDLADDTLLDPPDADAVAALLDAGTEPTTEHLTAVLHAPDGWPEVDPQAGVRAAREYRTTVIT